jgi:hypothetical protein
MSEQTQQPQGEPQPLGTLFGVLAYNDMSELEMFIERLRANSPADVLLTIHSALRYSQLKGAFSLEESEAVSIALRNLQDAMKTKIPNT